jgi:hypothetical protein
VGSYIKGKTMTKLFLVLTVAVGFSTTPPTYAQIVQDTETRAQVRADLIQLERAGYKPGRDDYNYPSDIQTAETKLAEQNATRTAIGGVPAQGSSQSGTTTPAR